ncbi:hypothetical protein SAMN05216559_1222 [Halomicrobium zhouii]|uniref:Uncharacterized protein n=1 Tax=Halomicrobium zhouii TaxID=767519 RepID=A0A1I6KPK4_9EURY|nr:hypothetical protein [Halomicrobium zhouii]SFR93111.1 hypothetical protein SAMN05216559_1222 [Halomicrobium zhouii]
MTGPTQPFREEPDEPEEVEESRDDRRLLALLALVLLVILGAGIGTIALPGTGPDEEPTPTPGPVTITPTTATPTPTPGAGPPAATATPTATPTAVDTATPTETRRDDRDDADVDDGDDDRDSDDDSPSRVDLTADGSDVLVEATGLAPGHDGRNSVTFENAGTVAGRLLVNDTSVVDHENSLLEPEKAVGDDATTGELSGALQVRLSVTYADGTTEYLFGSSSKYVTLQSLDGADRSSTEALGAGEQATVTFEWRLPTSTGNEIQSDGVEFDVDFVLRQAT